MSRRFSLGFVFLCSLLACLIGLTLLSYHQQNQVLFGLREFIWNTVTTGIRNASSPTYTALRATGLPPAIPLIAINCLAVFALGMIPFTVIFYDPRRRAVSRGRVIRFHPGIRSRALQPVYLYFFVIPRITIAVAGLCVAGLIATGNYNRDPSMSVLLGMALVGPHGIFEMLAVILAFTVAGRVYADTRSAIFTATTEAETTAVFDQIAAAIYRPFFRWTFAAVFGLLCLASLIESRLTPQLAHWVNPSIRLESFDSE